MPGKYVEYESDGQKVMFKQKYIDHYKELLGSRYDSYVSCSLTYLKRSVRVNTLKIPVSSLLDRLTKKGWALEQIPWCSYGFFLVHDSLRRDIGNLPEHMLGYIYIQEAASMIPPLVLGALPGERILDLCASPGSKSTQIAQMMENSGLLICNDLTIDRMKPLSMNLQRMGVTNSIVTLMDGHRFKNAGIEFDRVQVDAPCSGTGTVRKSFKTLRMWNENMLKRISHTQLSLLETAWSVVKPGGTVVYSTCSVEPVENEGVVSHFLSKHPDASLGDIDLNLKRSSCYTSFEGVSYHEDIQKCLRLWPMDNDTEGFFVAKLHKK